jgi:toxin ParE1/3/4
VNHATLRLSDAAVGDILEQAEWYHQQSGQMLAKRWESAVTGALLRLMKNPQSGPPCIFNAADLQGIRRMRIVKFPKHLIFYQIESGEVLILRVIHGARDLESLF